MKIPIKIIIALVLVIVAVVLALAVKHPAIFRVNTESVTVIEDEIPASEKNSPASAFAWRYEEGGVDLDGFPKTRIFLDTTYQNGTVTASLVDEVQGSCNSIDPSADDKDIAAGSTKIQCYAAGFGEWYKLVKHDEGYKVMRKFFVEAAPDSIPPEYTYEVVVVIPLLQ